MKGGGNKRVGKRERVGKKKVSMEKASEAQMGIFPTKIEKKELRKMQGKRISHRIASVSPSFMVAVESFVQPAKDRRGEKNQTGI